jgi:sec-independent protein translocase protein TatB
MFGIGLPEMIIILAVALIVVGPDKLPDLARSLAKGVNELRGAMNQIKESLNEETKAISAVQDDLRQTAVQMKSHLLDEPGGPRQPLNDEELAEKEADLTHQTEEHLRDSGASAEEVAGAEPDAAEQQQAESEAAPAEDDAEVTEETAVGRNPVPPPKSAA